MKEAIKSPFLTAKEAAAYLRMENADGSPNVNALYVARCKNGIKAVKRGSKLLFRITDLERFLTCEADLVDNRRAYPRAVSR